MSEVYLFGFVAMFLWTFWCALRGGAGCCWHHDAINAVGITFWALIWPVTMFASMVVSVLILRAELRRRDG